MYFCKSNEKTFKILKVFHLIYKTIRIFTMRYNRALIKVEFQNSFNLFILKN